MPEPIFRADRLADSRGCFACLTSTAVPAETPGTMNAGPGLVCDYTLLARGHRTRATHLCRQGAARRRFAHERDAALNSSDAPSGSTTKRLVRRHLTSRPRQVLLQPRRLLRPHRPRPRVLRQPLLPRLQRLRLRDRPRRDDPRQPHPQRPPSHPTGSKSSSPRWRRPPTADSSSRRATAPCGCRQRA